MFIELCLKHLLSYFMLFTKQGLQGFFNVRNSIGGSSSSPATSHINGLTPQRPPMLTASRPCGGIPPTLPPPHFPPHHPRPPSAANPPVGLLGSSSQIQVRMIMSWF